MEYSSDQQREATQTAEVPLVESSNTVAGPSSPPAEGADHQRADNEVLVTTPTGMNEEGGENLSEKVCKKNHAVTTDCSIKIQTNY